MFAITGNPGVGKHTIAKMVAKRLDLKLIDINTVAIKNRAIIAKDEISYLVDLKKLTRVIRSEITKNCLVVGHLAPYILRKQAPRLVIVVRRSPYELRRVYVRRGYHEQKVMDNISSEIIGMLMFDAVKKFGKDKVVEVDSTGKKPNQVAGEAVSIIKGRSKGSAGNIDWLSLVANRGDLQKFFEYKPIR